MRSAALRLFASLVLAGCGDGAGVARGYAQATGYPDVIARTTMGDQDIDRMACGRDALLYAFAASNGSGLICRAGNRTWFIARSDVAVKP